MKRWLLFVVCIWQFVSNVEMDIFAAYVRTLIVCDTPTTSHFSGSAHCGDKGLVVQEAANFTSIYGLTSNLIKVFLLPTIGALGDSRGRKPILMCGLVFIAAAMLLFGVAAYLISLEVTLATGLFMALSTTPNPMALAMMADVTTSESDRKSHMSAVFMAIAIGNMLGMVASMFLTHDDVSDYTWVFGALAGVSVALIPVAIFTLTETHAETARLKFNWKMANPFTSFQILWADPPLILIFATIMMAWMSGFGALCVINPLAVMLYGWSQMAALLPGFAYVVVNISMLAVQEHMKDRIPLYPSMRGAYIVFILGMVTLALLAPFHPSATFIACATMGLGVAFLMPTASTIVSLGLRKDEQAKGQSLATIAMLLGLGLGVFLYTGVLYDSKATGFRASIPFFVSLGLSCAVGVAIELFIIARRYRPLVLPDESSESFTDALLANEEAKENE